MAVIVVATSLAYAPCLNGDFLLDDDVLVADSPLIRDPAGIFRFWFTTDAIDYWPITNTSFWLEWRLWGMDATGYHVTNLLLHIAGALLIWRILSKLSVPGAFLAAFLFAVHPVNVESVAWIAQRKNLLALLFFLLSILSYVNAEKDSFPKPTRWYWLSLAAFVAAMLSKGSVAILPLVLVGIIAWLRPLTRRDLVRVVPFLLVTAVLIPVNMWFQSRFTNQVVPAMDLVERVLRAAAVTWFYLYKALLPLHLSFVYPKWQIDAGQLRWWLPFAAAVVATGVLWRYRRSRARLLLFAWAFFCLSLAPVMGFADIAFMEHSLVADHYQHISLLGVVAVVAAAWATWRERKRWQLDAVAVAACAALTFLTWQQSSLYADGITLFRATLERNPSSAFAENNLGLALLAAGRQEEAIAHWEGAIRLKPDYPEAHFNIGRTLFKMGDFGRAAASFRRALLLRPHLAAYHYNLGTALARLHQLPEAIGHLRQAVDIQPEFAEAHHNLGSVLLEAGRLPEAIEQYEETVQLEPKHRDAHYNLGLAFYRSKRLDDAREQFRRVLRLDPNYSAAHNALGVALNDAGRLDEAIEQFEQALRVNPDDQAAAANLEEVSAKKH